jgi:hypothetical protein
MNQITILKLKVMKMLVLKVKADGQEKELPLWVKEEKWDSMKQ